MTFEQECRRKFKEKLGRLVALLDEDMPDLIVAMEFHWLALWAEGFMGEFLHKEQLRRNLENLRQSNATCQHCDNGVAIALSHHPICEQCEARIDAEVKAIDEKLAE